MSPHGGPDGGNGGKGETLYFKSVIKLIRCWTLLPGETYCGKRGSWERFTKRGKDGKDLTIDLPSGTVVKDKKAVVS